MVADSRQQSGRQEMSKTDNPGLWTKALMPQEGARVRAASLCVCLCGGDRAERKRGFLGTHQVRGSQPTLVARAAPPPLRRTPQIPLFTPVPPHSVPGSVAPWCGVAPGTPWLLWPCLTIRSAPGRAGSVERRKEGLRCRHTGPHGVTSKPWGSKSRSP